MERVEVELALQVEQDILGPGWYPLACGCHLSVQARLPGVSGLVNLHGFGHRFCEAHGRDNFLNRWRAPKTWMHWYLADPQQPALVTQDQFQTAFDALEDGVGMFSHDPRGVSKGWVATHPSSRWVLSQGWIHKIYRTGAVEEATAMDIHAAAPLQVQHKS